MNATPVPNEPIATFDEGDWFAIKGRGMCFSFTKPAGFRPSDFEGRDIVIQGGRFSVRGVERHPLLHEMTAPEPIAVLVYPLDDAAELVLIRTRNALGKHRPRVV